MIFEGDTLIPVDRQVVWGALNDPEVLRACIPGCQSLEKHSETGMSASVRASVGPVSSTFKSDIILQDIKPGEGYTITGQGKGGAAGFARGEARVELVDEAGGTRLRYRADVNVGGRLAQVGSRLIQGTARKLSEQFFNNLSARLAGESELAAGRPPAPGRPHAPSPGGVEVQVSARRSNSVLIGAVGLLALIALGMIAGF